MVCKIAGLVKFKALTYAPARLGGFHNGNQVRVDALGEPHHTLN